MCRPLPNEGILQINGNLKWLTDNESLRYWATSIRPTAGDMVRSDSHTRQILFRMQSEEVPPCDHTLEVTSETSSATPLHKKPASPKCGRRSRKVQLGAFCLGLFASECAGYYVRYGGFRFSCVNDWCPQRVVRVRFATVSPAYSGPAPRVEGR